jgi:hypothetical protein
MPPSPRARGAMLPPCSPRSRQTFAASPRSAMKGRSWARPATATRLERAAGLEADPISILSPRSKRGMPLGAASAAAAIAREAAAAAALRMQAEEAREERRASGALLPSNTDDFLNGMLHALNSKAPSGSSVLAKARSRESAIMETPAADDESCPSGFSPMRDAAANAPAALGSTLDDDFVCAADAFAAILNDPRNDDGFDDDDDDDDAKAFDEPPPPPPAHSGMFAPPPPPLFGSFDPSRLSGVGRPSGDVGSLLVAELSARPMRAAMRNTMACSAERPRSLSAAPAPDAEALRSAELAAIFSRRKNGMSITPSKAPAFRR